MELHRKFARKSRDYIFSYANRAVTAVEVEGEVKKVKAKRCHASTLPSEANPNAKVHKPWEKKNLLLKLRDEGMVRHVLEGMLDIVEEAAVATVDLTED